MPLEIRELVIKVTIEDPEKQSLNEKTLQDYKKEIVKECTATILSNIKHRLER